MNDYELLIEYQKGSDHAFGELVARHISWLYPAALRQIKDPHLAEDVTQAVFIVLARRAARAPKQASLAPWLFGVMRHAVLNVQRAQTRREFHEKRAAILRNEQQAQTDEKRWEEIGPHIEEVIAKLPERDRRAVLLRFYEHKSYAEVGREMKISEEAARKVVDRAVEKLRRMLTSRGSMLSALALGTLLIAHACDAAALQLAPSISGSALLAAKGALSTSAAQLAQQTTYRIARQKLRAIALSVAAGAGMLMLIVFAGLQFLDKTSARNAPATQVAIAPPSALAPITINDPALAGYPIAPGYPRAFPGEIMGTPVLADVDGDGKPELIITTREKDPDQKLLHPKRTWAPLLHAIRADGAEARGFPVQLTDPQETPHRDETLVSASILGMWAGSPSVWKRPGGDWLVLNAPFNKGLRVIHNDGKMDSYPMGGKIACNIALADIDGDGVPDCLMANVLQNALGQPLSTWPTQRIIRNGFAPAIADVNGDGMPEIYMLSWRSGIRDGLIGGYDRTGQMLKGWPKPVMFPAAGQPALGKVFSSSGLDVVQAMGNCLCLWAWDGTPAPNTSTMNVLGKPMDGVLRQDISSSLAPIALADLDGDGKAEIVVFDYQTHAIRAFKGTGEGIANASGIIAVLPDENCAYSVSVADLGNDGVFDFFAGIYWVKFNPKTGETNTTQMVPAGEINASQPTICDLDGDGKADIVFGLRDGRVIVYQTGLSYRPEWCQWPTANGNFQHTGVWMGANAH